MWGARFPVARDWGLRPHKPQVSELIAIHPLEPQVSEPIAMSLKPKLSHKSPNLLQVSSELSWQHPALFYVCIFKSNINLTYPLSHNFLRAFSITVRGYLLNRLVSLKMGCYFFSHYFFRCIFVVLYVTPING
jgi:hypothetical protein